MNRASFNFPLSRRTLVKGAAAAPLVAAPLAAVLGDPMLARAAAESLQTVTTATASGGEVSASLALPDAAEAPGVILIHEWWGLNDQIKAVAADYAARGYVALAIDMFAGSVATTPEAARAQIQGLDPAHGREIAAAWIAWMRAHPRTAGRRIGTNGWCFGGGWSLEASLLVPVDATVIYYGNVAKSADELAPLAGPVLGHFATADQFIDKPMVDGFKAAMTEAGKPLTVYWYEADHGFANPTTARYDAEDAALAHERTLDFLATHLA